MLTSALAIHALLVLLCRFCKPDGLVMLLHIHDQSAESLIVVTCLWENAHMQYFVLVRGHSLQTCAALLFLFEIFVAVYSSC